MKCNINGAHRMDFSVKSSATLNFEWNSNQTLLSFPKMGHCLKYWQMTCT